MEKILVNKVQCNRCMDIIDSVHTHDFKWCSCGAIAVDGGLSYIRRVGGNYLDFDYTELSEVEDELIL